jgi:hypothetical protein
MLSAQEKGYVGPLDRSPSSFQYLADETGQRTGILIVRASRVEECHAIEAALMRLLARAPQRIEELLRHPRINGAILPALMINAPQQCYDLDSHPFTCPWYAELREGMNIHQPSTLLLRSKLIRPLSRPTFCVLRLLRNLHNQMVKTLQTPAEMPTGGSSETSELSDPQEPPDSQDGILASLRAG